MFAVSGSPSPPTPPPPRAMHSPASPAGLLYAGDRAYTRRGSAKWATAGQNVSLAEIAVGAAIVILSVRYLYQFTELTGVALGLLLVGSGASGVLGCARRSANIVNLQLVGCVVGIVLSFQFMAVVLRDVQVDCALAELYHRGQATQSALAEARAGEAMHAVHTRMAEMEDLLSLVQQGAAHQVRLARDQEQLRLTDLGYVHAKLGMLQRHAEEMLDSVLKNSTLDEHSLAGMSEEEKVFLRRRLDVADKVLDRIAKHHSGDASQALSIDEFTEILDALTSGEVAPERASHPELAAARAELPNMGAALQRQRVGQYETLLVGEAPGALRRLDEHRAERRREWEARFGELLQRETAKGGDYLADLPEHCVRETRGEKLAVAAGLAAVGVQLAGAYVALSLALRLPTKAE